MDEQQLLKQFAAEWARLGQGPPVRLEMHPHTAWAVLGTIQLACRHPGFDGPTRELAERFALQLQELIAAEGALHIVAEQGWRPAFDADEGDVDVDEAMEIADEVTGKGRHDPEDTAE